MGKPASKPDLAKMAGDIRALLNAVSDLQEQINMHSARLEKVEIVKAGPQERKQEPYKGEPDPQEPQPP